MFNITENRFCVNKKRIALSRGLLYNASINERKPPMRNTNAKVMALGGILAALALVIMCMGGLIPFATYVCPMLCTIAQYIVLQNCGKRTAWIWYVAVAILSLLLGPDKEAAAVFLLLGYYPIVKPALDKSRLRILWKLLLFNGAIALLYTVMIYLLGLGDVMAETEELGTIGLVIMLIMGNAVFFLLDRLLNMMDRKRRGK